MAKSQEVVSAAEPFAGNVGQLAALMRQVEEADPPAIEAIVKRWDQGFQKTTVPDETVRGSAAQLDNSWQGKSADSFARYVSEFSGNFDLLQAVGFSSVQMLGRVAGVLESAKNGALVSGDMILQEVQAANGAYDAAVKQAEADPATKDAKVGEAGKVRTDRVTKSVEARIKNLDPLITMVRDTLSVARDELAGNKGRIATAISGLPAADTASFVPDANKQDGVTPNSTPWIKSTAPTDTMNPQQPSFDSGAGVAKMPEMDPNKTDLDELLDQKENEGSGTGDHNNGSQGQNGSGDASQSGGGNNGSGEDGSKGGGSEGSGTSGIDRSGYSRSEDGDLSGSAFSSSSDESSGVGGGNGAQPAAAPPEVRAWIEQAKLILEQQGIHLSPEDIERIEAVIMKESGGDPDVQNNWDSNAAKGTPSIGLMQTIGPTFESYKLENLEQIAQQTGNPELQNVKNEVTNPIANIVAGVRYTYDRYGSMAEHPGISSMESGGGYQPY